MKLSFLPSFFLPLSEDLPLLKDIARRSLLSRSLSKSDRIAVLPCSLSPEDLDIERDLYMEVQWMLHHIWKYTICCLRDLFLFQYDISQTA